MKITLLRTHMFQNSYVFPFVLLGLKTVMLINNWNDQF